MKLRTSIVLEGDRPQDGRVQVYEKTVVIDEPVGEQVDSYLRFMRVAWLGWLKRHERKEEETL